MLKVVFNQDGSIKSLEFPHYVTQGSSGELESLKLVAAVDDLDLTDYTVIAVCKLPNGHTSSISLNQTNTDGSKYGYLTEAVTYYAGTLYISIQISDDQDNVLYTYEMPVTVNPTAYDSSELSDNITNAQYAYLTKQMSEIDVGYSDLDARSIAFYDSYSDANADINNLEDGKLVLTKDRGIFYLVRPQDGVTPKRLGAISEDTGIGITRSSSDVTTGTITNTAVLYLLLNYPNKVPTLELTTNSVPPVFESGYNYIGNLPYSYTRQYQKIIRTVDENDIPTITIKTITITPSNGEWVLDETTQKFYTQSQVNALIPASHLYRHTVSMPLLKTTASSVYGTIFAEILLTTDTPLTNATFKTYLESVTRIMCTGVIYSTYASDPTADLSTALYIYGNADIDDNFGVIDSTNTERLWHLSETFYITDNVTTIF